MRSQWFQQYYLSKSAVKSCHRVFQTLTFLSFAPLILLRELNSELCLCLQQRVNVPVEFQLPKTSNQLLYSTVVFQSNLTWNRNWQHRAVLDLYCNVQCVQGVLAVNTFLRKCLEMIEIYRSWRVPYTSYQTKALLVAPWGSNAHFIRRDN